MKTDASGAFRGLGIHPTTGPARTRQRPAWAHMQLTDRTTVAKVPLTGLSSSLWALFSRLFAGKRLLDRIADEQGDGGLVF